MFGRNVQREREKAAFLEELAEQRSATKGLVERYESEVKVARSAVLAAGRAREERDEYRRVLAAAIAAERRREAEVEDLKHDRDRWESLAQTEMRRASEGEARGVELGHRIEAVESTLREALSSRERALGDAADRAWSEREAARAELVEVVMKHRGEVATALDETRRELRRLADASMVRSYQAADPPVAASGIAHPGARSEDELPLVNAVRRRRAGLLMGVSLVATVAAIALAPLAALAVSDPERAVFVHMAAGLRPWHLLIVVALAVALAVGALSWALRDLSDAGRESEVIDPDPPESGEDADSGNAAAKDSELRVEELQPHQASIASE